MFLQVLLELHIPLMPKGRCNTDAVLNKIETHSKLQGCLASKTLLILVLAMELVSPRLYLGSTLCRAIAHP